MTILSPAGRFAFALALWLLGLSPALQAATLRGKIVRTAGYPVSYMKVTLRGSQGESYPVYTGGDGMYYFKNVAAGTYILEIWNQKNRPISYRIQVQEPATEVPVIMIP